MPCDLVASYRTFCDFVISYCMLCDPVARCSTLCYLVISYCMLCDHAFIVLLTVPFYDGQYKYWTENVLKETTTNS